MAEWIGAQTLASTIGAVPLFPNPRAENAGRRWTRPSSRRVWRRACAEAGVSFPENEGLRHAFGTHAVNRGVALDRVRKFMGHTSEKTAERYAKLGTIGLVDVLRPTKGRS